MLFLPVILSSLALKECNAFAGFAPSAGNTGFGHGIQQNRLSQQLPTSSSSSALHMAKAGLLLPESAMITPQGFGFSAPATRVLAQAGKGRGYHKALANDGVLQVTEAITGGSVQDVALVFDEESDMLLGLFTEADFIKFSTARARSKNEQDSASFLISPVKDHITLEKELIALTPNDSANLALALMNKSNVRHLVVAQKVTSSNRLPIGATSSNSIVGVINLQDVMSIIQKDESLSMASLGLLPEEEEAGEIKKQNVLAVGSSVLFVAIFASFFSQSSWLHDHADIAMIGIFILGYIGIIFEEVFEFNKAGVALLMSTGLWVTYADFFQSTGSASQTVLQQLGEQLAEVSDICFFLLAASTIVEVVDLHQGFKIVTNRINTKSKKELFWTIGFLTFFLSAILNNLTITIVMVSLLRKLVPNDSDRRLFGAMVVVAANAGGVWTPIGDVTTTMLWINNQLSTIPTVTQLFLPSLVCLIGSLAFLVNQVEEDDESVAMALPERTPLDATGTLVFWSGIATLLAVPAFAELTGLPPYLAMLTGLGFMWTLTDVLHFADEKEGLKVPAALARLDTSGILFFLGILMSIGVLDKSGLLKELALFLSDNLPNLDIIATVIGLASALIDNVPLVAATMGMYDLTEYGTDDRLWQLIALCAGTGGSILVIGSASGVALMGLEKVDFLWYAKNVSVGAAVGYFAGIAAYLVQDAILNGNFLMGSILPQAAVAVDVAQQSVQALI